jgi:hypothetical protein
MRTIKRASSVLISAGLACSLLLILSGQGGAYSCSDENEEPDWCGICREDDTGKWRKCGITGLSWCLREGSQNGGAQSACADWWQLCLPPLRRFGSETDCILGIQQIGLDETYCVDDYTIKSLKAFFPGPGCPPAAP